jgi:hypothetical protein
MPAVAFLAEAAEITAAIGLVAAIHSVALFRRRDLIGT